MATRIKISDVAKRWFSTGFMAGGVGSVDAGSHTLKDAVLVRPGEALGHGLWIDDEFCASLAAMGAALDDNGIKARFGHPGMCSEALGSFLGRWKNPRLSSDGRVVGDLHLSSTAAKSPKGDLRAYVEEMAAKEPQHFGASIVFTRNEQAEVEYALANGATVDGDYLDLSGFKSPDPRNTSNLPHARCAELHAADLVDDPAATDGMFSGASGMSLAAQMTEWLDTNPGVLKALNDTPELTEIVTRYADQLQPFLARYQAQRPALAAVEIVVPPEGGDAGAPAESPEPEDGAPGDCPTCEGEGTIECPDCNGTGNKPAAEPAGDAPAPAPAEPGASMQADRDALTAQLSAAQAEIAQLTGSVNAAGEREKALADQLAVVVTERDEVRRKLEAIEAGSPPVSSIPAEVNKPGSMWDDARKSKTRK